ncbi:4'-phosphopantetheinyl transferase family protein [Pseudoxanthomonas beigongshangi]
MPDLPSTAEAPSHPAWRFGRFQVWLRPHAPRTRGEPSARRVLADALAQPADTLPIRRDARGKPHLDAPFSDQAISWSHSGEVLLVALGPARDLGVDVERHRERPRMMEIAQRFFHPSELDWLRAQDDDARTGAFVRLWCAKEALLKAHGHGVSFGLEKLVFGEREGGLHLVDCDPALGSPAEWQLHEWEPLPGHRGALAWRT